VTRYGRCPNETLHAKKLHDGCVRATWRSAMNVDTRILKAQLIERMQDVAEFLLPAGQLSEDYTQWTVGDRTGKPGQSLKLELHGDKAGLWHDFATDEGGDILELWQSARSVNFKTALDEARQFLKDQNTLDPKTPVNGKKKSISKHNGKKKPRAPMKPKPTHTWYYKDNTGAVIGKVVRWDAVDGSSKQVKPYFNSNGSGDFTAGIPAEINDKRPLYGDQPSKEGTIIITEGEKAADAVRQMGFPACTSLGGCGAAKKADWSTLFGAKQVLVWADNDEPGMKYAHAVANQVHEIVPKADIRILTSGEASHDAADFVYGLLFEKGRIWDGYEQTDEIKQLAPQFRDLAKTTKRWRPPGFNPLKVLNKYLVTKRDVESIKSQTHKYKKCIPGGQLFILIGIGGSGKTTVMEFICRHIPGEVYYFNMDTSSVHIPEARIRAEEGNYNLLCPDLKGGIDQVEKDLMAINQDGVDLSEVTIVLDTIKKIMDMGDKGDIKRLMKVLRSLTTKGATVIGLGHTNKYENDDGWPNYEGTSDLRNDCDAMACLIHYRKPGDPDTIITSLYWLEQGWEHAKDRGEVEPATWVIDRSDNRKVTELETWVDTKKLNDEALQIEQAGSILNDLIEFLASQPEGVNQSQVVAAMAAIPHSRRQVLKHLNTYDGKLWSRQTKKELNAQVYTLLPEAIEYIRPVGEKPDHLVQLTTSQEAAVPLSRPLGRKPVQLGQLAAEDA